MLYEMLAGQRPFRGASAAETLAAVLREEPAPLAVPESLPGLERLVRRCLEKDPARRFQSADDLAFALEELRSLPSSPSQPSGPAPSGAFAPPAARPALAATGSGGGHTRAPGSRGGGRTLRGSAREAPRRRASTHLLPPRLGLPRALRARRPNGALQRGFRRRAARGLRDPPRQSRLAPARARTREPAGRVRRRDRDHTATELPADVLPAGTAARLSLAGGTRAISWTP